MCLQRTENGQRGTALAVFEFDQHLAGDFFQGFEDALALEGHGFEHRFALLDQLLLQMFDGRMLGRSRLLSCST